MRVPLLDLSEQYRQLAVPLRAEFDDIMLKQSFILGRKVEEFERAICDYCQVEHAIGVSSGTDALLVSLMALGITAGDAVLTTPYSFFATAGCVARTGATPVFVDIDPATYNLSAAALADYLKSQCRRDASGALRNAEGQRVTAIVPVHLYGLCCDMNAIGELARQYDLRIIEDAAQAIGAEFPSAERGVRQAGTMGDIGCFSFYPSKNLGAAGDAGMVICRDEKLAERLRILRQHGMEPQYFHQFIGGNFRIDALQAAILNVKLPHLNEWSTARRAAADFYRQEFTSAGLSSHVRLPAEPYRNSGLTSHHIYHQFVIATARRDELKAHLALREIGTAIYYPLGLHQQECFAYLGYKRGDFPETERAARETLALPIFPELTREMQKHVVASIAEFFKIGA